MLIFFAVLIGVLGGVLVPQNLPPSFTPFLAIGLLAACNTLFGGIAAQVHHKFDVRAFVFGFFINTILAMVLTFAGVKLGVDFSFAAIVYFGTRIFNNLAKIQHSILQKNGSGVKIKEIRDRHLLQLKKYERPFPPSGDGDDENTKRDML